MKSTSNFRQRSNLTEDCIASCSECYRVCKETIQYCLQHGGEHAKADHIALLSECAKLCREAEEFMICEAQSQKKLCKICAELCEACAISCEKFTGDSQMEQCAKTCRSCAEACKKMAV
jgi:hypothetical protein